MRRVLSSMLLAGCAAAPQDAPRTKPEEPSTPVWVFSALAYGYVVSGTDDYVSPVVTADRGPVHLEARYNYEAKDTTSLWGGWNIDLGGEAQLTVTPLLGLVFGDTQGVAPGYRFELGYERFDVSSEGEYMIDLDESADSFLYNWTEAGYAPSDWLRIGVVGQRTRIFDTGREIERGLLLSLTWRDTTFTTYVFEPFESDDRFWVFAAGLEF